MARGIQRRVVMALVRRDLRRYFSNPTGYVFLCIFVLLTSFAAFWPHEFFTTNLANFDQLNRFLPYIMLVFIPAMGEYVIPYLLGGPESLLIGRVLFDEFFVNRDWPLASSVAIVLLLLLVVPIVFYQRTQARDMETR